jgi:hypothetical protein
MEWISSASDFHCVNCDKLYNMGDLEYNHFVETYSFGDAYGR